MIANVASANTVGKTDTSSATALTAALTSGRCGTVTHGQRATDKAASSKSSDLDCADAP